MFKNLVWTKRLHFQFNPFEYLEASKDPHLGQYLVGNEAYDLARDDHAAFVFSPPGGGKTAMRIYVTRSCWQSLGGSHPFPIPYVLPYYLSYVQSVSLKQHLQWLLVAGAKALLAGLLYRPERFLEVSLDAQKKTVCFLDHLLIRNPGLQAPLSFYLDLLEEDYCPVAVLEPLGWRGNITDPPPATISRRLVAAMRTALLASPDFPTNVEEQWVYFKNLILSVFHFRSIFILMDGIDAFPETSQDLQSAFDLVEALFLNQQQFAKDKVFLKSFFPITKDQSLDKYFSGLCTDVDCVSLKWTPPLLAEMLRKRVHVASGGLVDSLDAYSTPDVFDLEERLSEAIIPLPREALRLTHFLMEAFEARLQLEDTDSLSLLDVRNAIERYTAQPVLPAI